MANRETQQHSLEFSFIFKAIFILKKKKTKPWTHMTAPPLSSSHILRAQHRNSLLADVNLRELVKV